MRNNVEELIDITFQLKQFLFQQVPFSLEEQQTTALQFMALRYISEYPACTVSELAKNIKSSISSTTQLTERLYKLGYVKRTQDKNDRRVTRLTITSTGVDMLEKIGLKIREYMKGVFSHIPKEDMTELIRIQKNLLENIKNNQLMEK